MSCVSMLDEMRAELKRVVAEHGWIDATLTVACAALSSEEAIGTPEEQDYPIQRGTETMLQVGFMDHKGQAFSREVFRDRTMMLKDVLELPFDSDGNRAIFIAATNAVLAASGLIDRTIHCKNQEPALCAKELGEITENEKVALFGLQPRFLEKLQELGAVRCVDIDPDLIGTAPGGITIEGPENTAEVIAWADRLLVTGSATVNATFSHFLNTGKPLHVFGTTGAGAAHILSLSRYCKMAI